MDKRVEIGREFCGLSCSRAARPRSRGGRSIRHRASPGTSRPSPIEQRLAAAWAQVLGMHENQIGLRDHFFDLGGTSLSAVKLAIALNRAVSLEGIAEHPILADMAELLYREHVPELLTSSSGRN